jgi:uncharacterized protein (DUF1501 family)
MLDAILPGRRGVSRRHFLKVGALGFSGLTLAETLRLRAAAAGARKETAVILFWLSGGPSHIDMYDPKPDAPREFRGEFASIATNVPGLVLSEHLPLQARLMDKLAVARSVAHTVAGHGNGAHWMMTGYLPSQDTADNLNPSCGSVAARMRGAGAPGIPAYVCLPDRTSCSGSAYLGVAYNPFTPGADPNDENFRVRNLDLAPRVDLGRLRDRRSLLTDLDTLRRDVDLQGVAEGYDRFYGDAMQIITGEACRAAFDLQKEDPRLRDRYGRDTWGQGALLARRLVEAGVTFVTLGLDGWDTHANNFAALKDDLLPRYDRALAALVTDLDDRGLSEQVLVVAMGEFGRTPRINEGAGRDHWPGVLSVLFAGGGLKTGQVVGASDTRAEAPKLRPLGPQDVLATVYHVLGIDPTHVFHDTSRRPMPILNGGHAIEELVG